ncbi:D-amino-acid oxidase [Folsomia candida]|uniref:D-amino-acid oxidase n=1 Tax=Folsomia candida TaxID=158441 RepID=A0A226EEV6_FOLCA|nr:D-amino-acid oxidase [Folsomia candida]
MGRNSEGDLFKDVCQFEIPHEIEIFEHCAKELHNLDENEHDKFWSYTATPNLQSKRYDNVKLNTSWRLKTVIIKCMTQDTLLVQETNNFLNHLAIPARKIKDIHMKSSTCEEIIREGLNCFISCHGRWATVKALRWILLFNEFKSVHDEMICMIDNFCHADGTLDSEKLKAYKPNSIPDESYLIPDQTPVTDNSPQGITLTINYPELKLSVSINIDSILNVLGTKVLDLVKEMCIPQGHINLLKNMYTNLELFGQLDFENARTFLVQALTECIKSSGAEDTIKGLQKHELIDVSTFSPSNPNENEFIKIKPDGNEGIPSAAKLAEELGLTSYRSATYAQVVKLSISD